MVEIERKKTKKCNKGSKTEDLSVSGGVKDLSEK